MYICYGCYDVKGTVITGGDYNNEQCVYTNVPCTGELSGGEMYSNDTVNVEYKYIDMRVKRRDVYCYSQIASLYFRSITGYYTVFLGVD